MCCGDSAEDGVWTRRKSQVQEKKICCWVVMERILYRLPTNASDPASSLPKLDEYLAVLRLMDDGDADRMFNPRKGM